MLIILASLLFIGAAMGVVAWIAFQAERERIKDDHAEYLQEQASLFEAAAQEVRQPLNSIVGLVSALQTTLKKAAADKDGVSEKLDLSLRELNDSLLRTLDIFDLSDGRAEIERSPVDVRTEIKILIRQRNKLLLQAQSDVKVVAGYIPELWFETDLLRFRQCISVLLDQAIMQTREGTVRVSFGVELVEGTLHRIAVAFKDNGRGMDQRRARSFFEPCHYEDNPELRGCPASMLSLNLAARAAKLLGGSMIAKSSVGGGTTFVFTFLAKACLPVPDKNGEQWELLEDAANPRFDELSVLLVDDNEVNLFVLQEFIMPLGFRRVVTASGGQEAIDRALTESFDLILMDLAMPEVDGLVASARIREGGPSQAAPIIAVSAKPMRADDPQLARAGIDDFVPKPVVNGDLLAAILRALPEMRQRASDRQNQESVHENALRLAAG